jgi:hypothetical protein
MDVRTYQVSTPRESCEAEELGRGRWAAITTLTAFGVRIGLRANARDVLDPVTHRVPGRWDVGDGTPIDRIYSVLSTHQSHAEGKRQHGYVLFAGPRRLAVGASRRDVCAAFEADLEILLASRSRGFIFVHAGAVSWKGQGIVIPGVSHSGKTTLVQAFLALGANYYSDEFAVFDSEGLLHPFPRALCVRSEVRSRRVSAARFGAIVGVVPTHARLVILTRYEPGVRWRPSTSSRAAGILGMIQHTLYARRFPRLMLSALERATQNAGVLEGLRGEAEETARSVLRELDG